MARLFIDLANKSERVCLTIDCSGVNPDRSGRFRIDAENLVMQTCYFNVGKDDQTFNIFLNKRLNNDKRSNNFYFKIDCMKSKTNNKTFNAKFELKKLSRGGISNVKSREFSRNDTSRFIGQSRTKDL